MMVTIRRPRVYRIVEYTNAWGGNSYGMEHEWEMGKYSHSGTYNPKVYWQATSARAIGKSGT